MHISIVIPTPRTQARQGMYPGLYLGTYKNIVPCYPGKDPGHSGMLTQFNRMMEFPSMQGRGLTLGHDIQLVPLYLGKYPWFCGTNWVAMAWS